MGVEEHLRDILDKFCRALETFAKFIVISKDAFKSICNWRGEWGRAQNVFKVCPEEICPIEIKVDRKI